MRIGGIERGLQFAVSTLARWTDSRDQPPPLSVDPLQQLVYTAVVFGLGPLMIATGLALAL